MANSKVMTSKKLSIWEYACRHMMTHDKFPSFRKIIENTSYSSLSELNSPLQELVEIGLLDAHIDKSSSQGRTVYTVAWGHWSPPSYYGDLSVAALSGDDDVEVSESWIKAFIQHERKEYNDR